MTTQSMSGWPGESQAVAGAESTPENISSHPLKALEFTKQLLHFLRPYRMRCLALVPVLLFQAFSYLVIPFYYKLIFDEAIGATDSGFLSLLLIGMGLFFVAITLVDLMQGYLAAGTGIRVMNDLRLKMFNHLQDLSLDFYTRTTSGDRLSRFTNDLNAIERALTTSLYRIVLNLLIVALCVVALFFVEWRLALSALVAMPLAALGPKRFGVRATRAGYKRRKDEARISELLQENFAAQKVIRAFGLRSEWLKRFCGLLEDIYQSALRTTLFNAYMEKTSGLSILLVQLAVVGLGAHLVVQEHLTQGELVGFVGLLLNTGSAISVLISAIPDVTQAVGGMQRINELLAEKADGAEAEGGRIAPLFSNEIRFDTVGFSYGGGQPLLENLRFTIPAGKSVAFVGGSGSGKTTILNLLAGFYTATTGAITIDGQDVRDISMASYRSQIGPVFQDTFLFHTTLRENIRQGRLDATNEEVEQAAHAAEIHDFIVRLPQGYDTVVGEMGSRLSGGQRQRVALARAILRNPAILLLDEATSALDPKTEAAINATLEKLARNRTVVAVTHRLSSAMNADHIFVLDAGRIAEQGRHKDLLNRKGIYFQMWQEFTLELTQSAIIGQDAPEVEPEAIELPVAGEDSPLTGHIRELENRLRAQELENQHLKEINQRWAQLAGTDRLTGLPNKVAFLRALAPQEIRYAQREGSPIGFILLSGDNLGPINETYGRNAGDRVIQGLSELLQSVLMGEELLGHIDGTHFAVVRHPATLEELYRQAEDLRARVESHTFSYEDATLRITISAGVAALPAQTGTTPEDRADKVMSILNRALYTAKRAGGNCVEIVGENDLGTI